MVPDIEGNWLTVIKDSLNVEIDFQEFVNFDSILVVCGQLSEIEILNSVKGELGPDGEAEDDEDEGVSIYHVYIALDATKMQSVKQS